MPSLGRRDLMNLRKIDAGFDPFRVPMEKLLKTSSIHFAISDFFEKLLIATPGRSFY